MNVGKTIRAIREQKGWSQVTLANACGINVNSIRKYELGIRNPKAEQVDKIADALQVNRSMFYDLNLMTVGDVMSLLFLIDEATNLTIKETDNDGKKNFIIEFEQPPMNEALHKWCTFMEKYNNDLERFNRIDDEGTRSRLIEELDNTAKEVKSRIIVTTPESNRVITKNISPDEIAIKITNN